MPRHDGYAEVPNNDTLSFATTVMTTVRIRYIITHYIIRI